jgi:FkbM family methyltransferase
MNIPAMEVTSRLDHTLKINLKLAVWVDFNIYCLGLYEHYLANFFKKQLKPGTVFIDVGAYIGQYALLAARDAHRGQVYAFEPHPESVQRLKAAVADNLLGNLRVIDRAVGNQVGTVTFYISNQPFMSSTVASHTAYQRAIDVPMTTLDTFCGENGVAHVDIVKIDVEETELAVVQGALTLLEESHPLVIMEIGERSLQEDEPEVLRYLKALRYQFFTLKRNHLMPLSNQISGTSNLIAIPLCRASDFIVP